MAKRTKGAAASAPPGNRTISFNRRALHNYTVLETMEAGLVLTGTEIKSVRAGRISLAEGYARSERGEVWLHGVHIAPYEAGNRYNVDPLRRRKLLLHKNQVLYLAQQTEAKGLTLIPLRLYIRNHVAKVEIAVARGKRVYDKRESIARRDAEREMERGMKRGRP